MSRSRVGVGTEAIVVGALAIVAARLMRPKSADGAPAGSAAPPVGGWPLSARRLRALALIAEVVPSVYGDERFTKLAPTWDPATMKGTTCGYLPCYVGRGLELQKAISQCGLEQLRTNARAWGAWVDASEAGKLGSLPRPGDVYGIDQPDGGLLIHVGIIVGPDETADAGQGTHEKQEAKRVKRSIDWKANPPTIDGPLGSRRLAGWCDLDKVPAIGAVAGGKRIA